MKSISVNLLEAALVEREEYLEELKKLQGGVEEQITNLQYEIDELLLRIYDTYRQEKEGQ